MPFVQGKCENCGGVLAVDPSQKAAICPFCGVAYVVQDSINYYNTTMNISANVVNFYGDSKAQSDFEVVGGVLEKYTGASTDVDIPNNVTIIGRKAFSGCIGITKVCIPDSVTQIQEEAFMDCRSLQKVVLPTTMKLLADRCFSGCENLQEINIPNSVDIIGAYAFNNCRKIHAVRLPSSVNVDARAFSGVPDLVIDWPSEWAYKQLTKLRIVTQGNIIVSVNKPYEPNTTVPLIFMGFFDGKYVFQDLDYYNASYRPSVFDNKSSALCARVKYIQSKYPIITNLEINSKQLEFLLDRAGISRGCVQTISIPKYIYQNKKLLPVGVFQLGSVFALQANIIFN